MYSEEHMNNHHLNFILIPLMSPGRIIPMFHIAKHLAQQGVTATIITTTHNVARFHALIHRAAASGLSIKLLSVKFPSAEAGLPEGCECSDNLPSYDLMNNFFSAIGLLQEPMEKIIEGINPAPCCIICDKYMFWTVEIAQRYKIPRILFDGMSCLSVLCVHNLYHITEVQEIIAADQNHHQSFIVPNIPDEIVLTKSQLPGIFNPGWLKLDDFLERVRESEKEAFGVVVNSFEELESSYVDGYRSVIKGGKVWCVGPLSLCSKEALDKAQRGNYSSSLSKYDKLITEWLDLQEHGKVVYACLGSLTRLPPTQFVELALGLEEADYPFILVMKAQGKAKEDIERWILDNGFEERTKGRSFLIRDWAPQGLILSHPAIGGFLTHCGWNSTIEGISEGVPLITWPMFGEQFLNEKQVVQILKNGASVGTTSARHLGGELGMAEGVTVKMENIHKAILKVMNVDEEDAKETRKNAKQLGEMSKMAMEKGGSSHGNISLLIKEITTSCINDI